jgi:hypothetical protein
MDDEPGAEFLHERQYGTPIPDIERAVRIFGNLVPQSAENPAGISIRPEENGAMVAVDAGDPEALASKIDCHL